MRPSRMSQRVIAPEHARSGRRSSPTARVRRSPSPGRPTCTCRRSVSAATLQACSASISTPVRSTVSTCASIADEVVADLEVHRHDCRPAADGTAGSCRPSASRPGCPRPSPPTARRPSSPPGWRSPTVVSGFMNTLQRATARRWVGSLGVTSTMRARPRGSRWVNDRSLMWIATLVAGTLRRCHSPTTRCN